MGMSAAYGVADEKESIKTLHRALELGINFWDTADVYGNGANEELITIQSISRKKKSDFHCNKINSGYPPYTLSLQELQEECSIHYG